MQEPAQQSHASGVSRGRIRRLVRRKPDAVPCPNGYHSKQPFSVLSLGRPDHDETNGTHTDSRDLIPTTLHERDGRNDKIRLHCEICTVTFEHKEDIRDFIFHLGGPPSDQRSDREQFSRLFTIAPRQGLTDRLVIRSKKFTFGGDTLQPPLFSGHLKIRWFKRDDNKFAMFITANLFLNVNRVLNHQRSKLARRQAGAIFKSLNPTLQALTMADNLAPLVLCPNEHDNARAEYIKQTVAAIREDVQRAADQSILMKSSISHTSATPPPPIKGGFAVAAYERLFRRCRRNSHHGWRKLAEGDRYRQPEPRCQDRPDPQ